MGGKHRGERPEPLPLSFIGSFAQGPGQALIVLRGDLDAEVVERLRLHIDGLLETGTRFLTIDAAAVVSYDPCLLSLLGQTQGRLGTRAGIVVVHGLARHLVPADGTPSDADVQSHVGAERIGT